MHPRVAIVRDAPSHDEVGVLGRDRCMGSQDHVAVVDVQHLPGA